MLNKIIHFSISERFVVLAATLGLIALGAHHFEKLPIDAVPDITNVQVQINTEARGYSPFEVEQRVTFPIETTLSGIPALEYTRSLSRYGLSQVTVVFKDGTDIYFARSLLNAKLQEIRSALPPGLDPVMGPISTGLGEIYMYSLEAKPGAKKQNGMPYDLMDLRTLHDWVVKPQLRTVPGVVESNTSGGFEKQFHVTPDPDKMAGYGLSFKQVAEALIQNNANVGGGYIEHNGEQRLIRGPGQITSMKDIESVVAAHVDGVPVHVHDVAEVGLGKELRTGASTRNGEETVLGTVMMLMGENSRTVSKRVDEKIKEIARSLPEGIKIQTLYDRTKLVEKTMYTVSKNLLEGAILVIVVLFLFLGYVRAALVTACVIPLAMLFTIVGMVEKGVSANLMSLGALDFGLIVDGAVIIVENCLRSLSEKRKHLGRMLIKEERLKLVFEATGEVSKPSVFGTCIIMAVYLPIMALSGIEGKVFHPMAITVMIALLGAMILSVTFVPAAIALFFSGDMKEKENPLLKVVQKSYAFFYPLCFQIKGIVLAATGVFLVLCLLLATRMGSEFIPTLDEGDIAVQAIRIPGASLSQCVEMQCRLEKKIKSFSEIQEVFSRIGTSEVATDPMPPNVADTYVLLNPRNEWPNPEKTKEVLLEELETTLKQIPGNNYEFTQPIQMRFNELIAGVRADVALKIFGEDMEALQKAAIEAAEIFGTISGASDVRVEQLTGLPVLNLVPNREKLAQYGLNLSVVQEIIRIAMGGEEVGELFEGDKRFPIVVRLPEKLRQDEEALKRIPVPLPRNEGEQISFIPLGSVVDFIRTTGPNQMTRENSKRRVVVSANVRGRDLGSFVKEAQEKIQKGLSLPAGYWTGWGGQFENLLSATKRLQIVVPIVLFLIGILLYTSLRSMKDALLVFTGIPLALTGGILSLYFRDMPLSISAGVGFIALSGIAVLNGLVMVSFIQKLRQEGMSLEKATEQGCFTRLRPVLMTALVAALGFVPMAISQGVGAEVQKPLATVVIGGILSSTFLTLFVLPILYLMFHTKKDDV